MAAGWPAAPGPSSESIDTTPRHLPLKRERVRPMMDDTPETSTAAEKFDESAFPGDILFHDRRGAPDRRGGLDRRDRFGRESDTQGHPPRIAKERRARK